MDRRLSRRLDTEIAEGAGHAVNPQSDIAFSMAQPIDDQAGLRAAVDRDGDLLFRHFDAGVKPPCGIGNRLDGGLVNTRLVLAQFLPRVLRPRDVLHRVTARGRVLVAESERTKVHRFEGLGVRDAEHHAEETRLLLTGAPEIDLQRAFRELHVLEDCQTDVATNGRIAMRFQTHDWPLRAGVRVDHSPDARVVHPPEIGSDAGLGGEDGDAKEDGSADHYGRRLSECRAPPTARKCAVRARCMTAFGIAMSRCGTSAWVILAANSPLRDAICVSHPPS